jgi:hypothetical protein
MALEQYRYWDSVPGVPRRQLSWHWYRTGTDIGTLCRVGSIHASWQWYRTGTDIGTVCRVDSIHGTGTIHTTVQIVGRCAVSLTNCENELHKEEISTFFIVLQGGTFYPITIAKQLRIQVIT